MDAPQQYCSFRLAQSGLAAIALAVTLAGPLAGCSSDKWGFPYRASVQQGNWLTQEQIAQLKKGMTRDQVRYVLGSPTLADALHADRWDYPYFYKPGYGNPEERKFTVWFDHDTLARWSGDKEPDKQPFQLDPDKANEAVQRAIQYVKDDALKAESKNNGVKMGN